MGNLVLLLGAIAPLSILLYKVLQHITRTSSEKELDGNLSKIITTVFIEISIYVYMFFIIACLPKSSYFNEVHVKILIGAYAFIIMVIWLGNIKIDSIPMRFRSNRVIRTVNFISKYRLYICILCGLVLLLLIYIVHSYIITDMEHKVFEYAFSIESYYDIIKNMSEEGYNQVNRLIVIIITMLYIFIRMLLSPYKTIFLDHYKKDVYTEVTVHLKSSNQPLESYKYISKNFNYYILQSIDNNESIIVYNSDISYISFKRRVISNSEV